MLTRQQLLVAAARIRLLVLDVDGVLTDGRLHYDVEGREFKSFHVRDGLGIQQVMETGIAVAVISGRASRSAAARMAELRIPHVVLGRNDKLAVLLGLVKDLQLTPDVVACVGDDVTDLEIMGYAGLAIAVADAHPKALEAADWLTSLPGGRGAVREVCDVLTGVRRPSAG